MGFEPSMYDHNQVVWGDDLYTIYWKIDAKRINLALKVKTHGWIGFGIAEQTSGTMGGSDIIQGYVVDGSPKIMDRHAMRQYPSTNFFMAPKNDDCQDWELSSGEEIDEFTILEISRLLDTNDLQDRPISPDNKLTKIILAYGANDEDGFDIQHSKPRRKATSINFSGSMVNDELATFLQGKQNVETKDIMMQWTVTTNSTIVESFNGLLDHNETIFLTTVMYDKETVYATGYFGLFTEIPQDKHLIAIEHLIQPETGRFVHHFVLQAMTYDWGSGSPLPTRGPEMVYAWAPGTKILLLDQCGFRLSNDPKKGFNAFTLEVHYDNPAHEEGISDYSGVRLHYTSDLLAHDCGMMQVGNGGVGSRDSIPKGITKYDFECDFWKNPDVPEDYEGHSEITIVNQFLHMHAVGREIWLDKLHNGTVTKTHSIEFWDFNFQISVPPLIGEYKMDKGDKYSVSCIYETADDLTKWGAASNDEMCIAFVLYYPISPVYQQPCYTGMPWQTSKMENLLGFPTKFGEKK